MLPSLSVSSRRLVWGGGGVRVSRGNVSMSKSEYGWSSERRSARENLEPFSFLLHAILWSLWLLTQCFSHWPQNLFARTPNPGQNASPQTQAKIMHLNSKYWPSKEISRRQSAEALSYTQGHAGEVHLKSGPWGQGQCGGTSLPEPTYIPVTMKGVGSCILQRWVSAEGIQGCQGIPGKGQGQWISILVLSLTCWPAEIPSPALGFSCLNKKRPGHRHAGIPSVQ